MHIPDAAHVETDQDSSFCRTEGETECVFRAILPLPLYRNMNEVRIQKKLAERYVGWVNST
jgi:hypothetical protein